jgi:hypothetical protein
MVTYAQGVACTEMLPSLRWIAGVAAEGGVEAGVGVALEVVGGEVGVAVAVEGTAEDDGGRSVSIAPRSGESIGEGL